MTPLERVREMVESHLARLDLMPGDTLYRIGRREAYHSILSLISDLELEQADARATPRCPVEFEEGEG